jgi:hypothetical protein
LRRCLHQATCPPCNHCKETMWVAGGRVPWQSSYPHTDERDLYLYLTAVKPSSKRITSCLPTLTAVKKHKRLRWQHQNTPHVQGEKCLGSRGK